jgi:hypothetical protein
MQTQQHYLSTPRPLDFCLISKLERFRAILCDFQPISSPCTLASCKYDVTTSKVSGHADVHAYLCTSLGAILFAAERNNIHILTSSPYSDPELPDLSTQRPPAG